MQKADVHLTVECNSQDGIWYPIWDNSAVCHLSSANCCHMFCPVVSSTVQMGFRSVFSDE